MIDLHFKVSVMKWMKVSRTAGTRPANSQTNRPFISECAAIVHHQGPWDLILTSPKKVGRPGVLNIIMSRD